MEHMEKRDYVFKNALLRDLVRKYRSNCVEHKKISDEECSKLRSEISRMIKEKKE